MASKYSKFPDYIIDQMVEESGENKTKVKKTLKKAERIIRDEIEDLDPEKSNVARTKYLGNILTITRDMLGISESKEKTMKEKMVEDFTKARVSVSEAAESVRVQKDAVWSALVNKLPKMVGGEVEVETDNLDGVTVSHESGKNLLIRVASGEGINRSDAEPFDLSIADANTGQRYNTVQFSTQNELQRRLPNIVASILS